MHARAGDPPYAGTADAIGRWPETCTAVAARLAADGRVEVLAPWGVTDLLGLVVRPTPAFARRLDVFERVRAKEWTERRAGITVSRAR